MEAVSRYVSRAIIYIVPAALITAGLGSLASICTFNILLGLVMVPGTAVIMAAVGLGVGAFTRFVLKKSTQMVQDATILAGLIVGGALALVFLTYLGANPVWAARGALVGALGGVGYLGYRTERSLSRNLAARRVENRLEEVLRTTSPESLADSLKELLLDCEMALGSLDPTTARVVRHIADAYRARQRIDVAETLYKRVLYVYQEYSGDTTLEQSQLLHEIATMYLAKEDTSSAIPVCRRALSLRESKESQNSLGVARIRWTLAQLYAGNEKYREAVAIGREALESIGKHFGASHPETVEACQIIALYCQEAGQTNTALDLITSVLKRQEDNQEQAGPALLKLLAVKANIETELGKKDQAAATKAKALVALKQHGGPEHPKCKEVLDEAVDLLYQPEWTEEQKAFWSSVARGEQSKAKVAIDQDATLVELVDSDGWTVFHWVAFWDMDRLLESLLFRGGKIPNTGLPPTLVAARWGNRKTMASLLSRGAEVEARDQEGNTILHTAVLSGDTRTVEVLSHRGTKFNLKNDQGQTSLWLAASLGLDSMVVELLARGSDINLPDQQGRTPLHIAVEKGHETVIQCLVYNGARTDLQDQEQRRPKDRAAQLGFQDLVQLLASHEETEETPSDG